MMTSIPTISELRGPPRCSLGTLTATISELRGPPASLTGPLQASVAAKTSCSTYLSNLDHLGPTVASQWPSPSEPMLVQSQSCCTCPMQASVLQAVHIPQMMRSLLHKQLLGNSLWPLLWNGWPSHRIGFWVLFHFLERHDLSDHPRENPWHKRTPAESYVRKQIRYAGSVAEQGMHASRTHSGLLECQVDVGRPPGGPGGGAARTAFGHRRRRRRGA